MGKDGAVKPGFRIIELCVPEPEPTSYLNPGIRFPNFFMFFLVNTDITKKLYPLVILNKKGVQGAGSQRRGETVEIQFPCVLKGSNPHTGHLLYIDGCNTA